MPYDQESFRVSKPNFLRRESRNCIVVRDIMERPIKPHAWHVSFLWSRQSARTLRLQQGLPTLRKYSTASHCICPIDQRQQLPINTQVCDGMSSPSSQPLNLFNPSRSMCAGDSYIYITLFPDANRPPSRLLGHTRSRYEISDLR